MRACTLPRAFGPSSGLLIGLALLLLAGACSSASVPQETVAPSGSADPSTAAPSTAAAGAPEEAVVPFVVCQSSDTWTRPSEEEQSQQIWHGPFGFRYDNWAPAMLRSTFYEDFFTWHGGNSELFDSWPLHGLWTAEDLSHDSPCAEGGRVGREVISVYLLLHEARAVTLSGNTYRITGEATPAGFHEIQFPNLVSPQQPRPAYPTTASFRAWFHRWGRGSRLLPESPAEEHPVPKEQPTDYNLLIVDMSGRELARADGGLRFERPTEGSAVPQATQAATAGGAGP